jgi:hypothetical protein
VRTGARVLRGKVAAATTSSLPSGVERGRRVRVGTAIVVAAPDF